MASSPSSCTRRRRRCASACRAVCDLAAGGWGDDATTSPACARTSSRRPRASSRRPRRAARPGPCVCVASSPLALAGHAPLRSPLALVLVVVAARRLAPAVAGGAARSWRSIQRRRLAGRRRRCRRRRVRRRWGQRAGAAARPRARRSAPGGPRARNGTLVAADGDSVWVVMHGATPPAPRSELLQLDARNQRLLARIPYHGLVTAISLGAGGLWLADADRNRLERIDPRTHERTGLLEGVQVEGVAADRAVALDPAGRDRDRARRPRSRRQPRARDLPDDRDHEPADAAARRRRSVGGRAVRRRPLPHRGRPRHARGGRRRRRAAWRARRAPSGSTRPRARITYSSSASIPTTPA